MAAEAAFTWRAYLTDGSEQTDAFRLLRLGLPNTGGLAKDTPKSQSLIRSGRAHGGAIGALR